MRFAYPDPGRKVGARSRGTPTTSALGTLFAHRTRGQDDFSRAKVTHETKRETHSVVDRHVHRCFL